MSNTTNALPGLFTEVSNLLSATEKVDTQIMKTLLELRRKYKAALIFDRREMTKESEDNYEFHAGGAIPHFKGVRAERLTFEAKAKATIRRLKIPFTLIVVSNFWGIVSVEVIEHKN